MKPDEPGLGLRAAARRALVADLSARARRGAGVRRDRSRMVVRLHFHDEVHRLIGVAVDARRGVGPEPAARRAVDDRGVVLVRGQHARRGACVRVADHRKQAFRRALAVDDPIGVEDLVPAMLRVRLREHHELDVARVAPHGAKLRREVVDLVGRKREAELAVRAFERAASAGEDVDSRIRLAARARRTAATRAACPRAAFPSSDRAAAARLARARGRRAPYPSRGGTAGRARCGAPAGCRASRCRWLSRPTGRSCRAAARRRAVRRRRRAGAACRRRSRATLRVRAARAP